MINIAIFQGLREPKVAFAKAMAWLFTLPPALYLVSQQGKSIGILKETSDGSWQFQSARDEAFDRMTTTFASPAAFLAWSRERGHSVRLDHVPFPG